MSAPRNAQSSGGKRFYVWRGERYFSVTTIINGGVPKPVLVNWAKLFTAKYAVENYKALGEVIKVDEEGAIDWLKNASFRSRDKAAELGSAVHAASEAFKLGKPMPPWSPLIKARMSQYERFLDTYRPKIHAAEASVYNKSEKYAGTLDAIATVGKRKLLYDIKTGKGVYPEVALQLAAYRFAEFIGLPDGSQQAMPEVDGCAVLHLTDEGFDFREVDASDNVWLCFRYVREVFRWQNEIAKHVLGPTIKPPRKRRALPEAADRGASKAATGTRGSAASESALRPAEPEPGPQAETHAGGAATPPPPRLSSDGAEEQPSGSDQIELLPSGPRSEEQEAALGVDIFGEAV